MWDATSVLYISVLKVYRSLMEKTWITKLELSINKGSLENGVKNRSRRETRQTLTRYNNAAIKYSIPREKTQICQKRSQQISLIHSLGAQEINPHSLKQPELTYIWFMDCFIMNHLYLYSFTRTCLFECSERQTGFMNWRWENLMRELWSYRRQRRIVEKPSMWPPKIITKLW